MERLLRTQLDTRYAHLVQGGLNLRDSGRATGKDAAFLSVDGGESAVCAQEAGCLPRVHSNRQHSTRWCPLHQTATDRDERQGIRERQ